jgi:primosomal protein N' (replication factor Y)
MTHDYLGFARDEIRIRRLHGFPPYTRLVVCTITHREDTVAETRCLKAMQAVRAGLEGEHGIHVHGPSPAFLHRLRGEYRWQFTVKGTGIERSFSHLPGGRGWITDVDPAM